MNAEQPDPLSPDRKCAVLAIDNVALDLDLAGVGSRVLAASVDYFMLFFLQVSGLTILATLASLTELPSTWLIVLVVLAGFALQWGYFVVLELVMDGRTPGKALLGLRVISRHGGRAGVASILVRNLLRVLDLFFGVPFLLIDARARRLGDLVAGTLVVHDAAGAGASQGVAVGRMPPGWGAKEAAVAESFLRRAERLEPARAQRLATELLLAIGRSAPELLPEPRPSDAVQAVKLALAVREVA